MKKIALILLVLSIITSANAQMTGGGNEKQQKQNTTVNNLKNSVSIQGLKFGLGFDYERFISKHQGLAISAGILGAEVETKYHFKPRINSSSIGIGTGIYFFSGAWQTQVFYEYRAKKFFVFNVGGGFAMLDGDISPTLRLSAGVYFPW